MTESDVRVTGKSAKKQQAQQARDFEDSMDAIENGSGKKKSKKKKEAAKNEKRYAEVDRGETFRFKPDKYKKDLDEQTETKILMHKLMKNQKKSGFKTKTRYKRRK